MGEGRYLQVLSGEGKRLIQVEKFYLSGVLDLGEVNIFDRGSEAGGVESRTNGTQRIIFPAKIITLNAIQLP
jgi:hypothetical protein